MPNHYKHFKHLHVPESWENYWSKYPNGYSLLEALLNWVNQVNDMSDNLNQTNGDVACLQRNFNALDKELRASWSGYKDSTTKQYADFRDEVFTIINNWIASIEPTIQNEVVSSLTKWLSDGTLADIINKDVFDKKIDRVEVEQLKTDLETKIGVVESGIDTIENKLYVSVTDFGAVGDGVTDDTPAIQNAINTLVGQEWATIVFPPTSKSYLVSTLTIPDNAHTATFQGIGLATLEFTNLIGFKIMSEFIKFDNLKFVNKKAIDSDSTIGTKLFVDERTYKRLDFDLTVQNCYIRKWQRVVETWGRGVILSQNTFSDITEVFIHLSVKPKAQIDEGGMDIQTYEEGYRAYRFIGNRVHYSNAVIMVSVFDTQKVVQGVDITNNYIEGGTRYYQGYVKNLLVENNTHFHLGTTGNPLLDLKGCHNVVAKLHVANYGGKKASHVAMITDIFSNVSITGNVGGFNKNMIGVTSSGRGLYVDLNVTDFGKGSYVPNLLSISGASSVVGLIVKGLVESPDNPVSGSAFVPIHNNGTGTVEQFNFDGLVVLGKYSHITNID